MALGAYIVIDLGKTLAKVSLWSRSGEMLDRRVRPNQPVTVDGKRRLDAQGIGEWILEALRAYCDHPIEAIVPVGHGAAVAPLVGNAMAFLPLDYEQPLPPDILQAYRTRRDPFATTGSPALPDGLNLGAQLYWLELLYPEEMREAVFLPWAQYWAWFLTGRAVSEVTSLGCHSDLWNPTAGCFAPLAREMGWAERFAPLANAGDVVGTIAPEVSAATGLQPTVKVLAGIHDTNAALLAARGFREIADCEATVLSTGTWFIAMRLAAELTDLSALPEARDCLVNVDAFGRPVPSARFMGGREIESIIEIDTRRVDIKPDQPHLVAAVPQVLAAGSMMLPTLAPGCGPYSTQRGRWISEPADWYQKRAAMCLYAALVAETSLKLIGSAGSLLVEGRFAEAEVFVRAVARLRPDLQVYTANAHNDVSFGAIRLIDPTLAPHGSLVPVEPLDLDLSHYQQAWCEAMVREQTR